MIATDGLKFIIAGLVITVLLICWGAAKDSRPLFALAALFALLTVFVTFFYRNPKRPAPPEPDIILSLADGKILSVEEIDIPYIGGRGHKISIFLSIFDVHINRIPVTGQIDYVKYNPGKYFAAFKDKASTDNEQTEIGMNFGSGQLIFKQIAGVLARRIVCHLENRQAVKAGEIFGMIHFGSRAELFLPANVEVMVKAGDYVKGGLSIIGRIGNLKEKK